jgi:hypothetical protein
MNKDLTTFERLSNLPDMLDMPNEYARYAGYVESMICGICNPRCEGFAIFWNITKNL